VAMLEKCIVNRAIINGWQKVVPYLIETRSCTIDEKTLDYAIMYAHDLQLLKYFVEKCNCCFSAQNITTAILSGNFAIVEYVIPKRGYTPKEYEIYIAASYGYLDILKYLLRLSGTILLDKAAIGASFFGHLDVLKYLIEECGYDFCKINICFVKDDSIIKYLKTLKGE
jgi:hypothetical protein